jgi:hypothetical protein
MTLRSAYNPISSSDAEEGEENTNNGNDDLVKPTTTSTLDDLETDNGERVTVVILDSAQKKFPIAANPNWTIERFKRVGTNIHKIPPPSQRLIFRGKMLEDSKTLKECGIDQENVIVHLFPKPRVVVTSSNSYLTDNSSGGEVDDSAAGGAHVPQIILDAEEQERRGQILVLGSPEIQEAQNNVKLLSLLLLVVCSMRLLALFSIAMGVAEEPVYEDDMFPSSNDTGTDTNHHHTNGSGGSGSGGGGSGEYNPDDYQPLAWETQDYFDLAVSAIGFYVATLGMKATTENTLRLANAYLVGVVIAGIGWNAWNVLMYALFVQEEEKPSSIKDNDDDDMIPLTSEDFVTVAFFTIMLPMCIWFLCCTRAYQFRMLIEEAEQEAAERIQSQLTLSEGGNGDNDNDDDDGRELTELSSSSRTDRNNSRTTMV